MSILEQLLNASSDCDARNQDLPTDYRTVKALEQVFGSLIDHFGAHFAGQIVGEALDNRAKTMSDFVLPVVNDYINELATCDNLIEELDERVKSLQKHNDELLEELKYLKAAISCQHK